MLSRTVVIHLLGCLLVHSRLVCFCLGDPVAGPFRIIFDHAEPCPPELLDLPFEITLRHTRDRHKLDRWRVTSNMTLHETVDDDCQGQIRIASWSSRGGWKDNAFLMNYNQFCRNCDVHLPAVTADLKRHIPGPNCPVRRGDYYFPNITADTTVSKKFPAFFYGKWRADGKVLRSRKVFACVRIYIATVPILPGSG